LISRKIWFISAQNGLRYASSMANSRKLVLLATATAVVIAALCFLGNSPVAGVKLATVVTARFSGLLFAFALVARASQFVSRRASLMLAFVAAHGVHFATVLAGAIIDGQSPFHNFKPQTFITFAVGFSIIGLLAFTTRAASRAGCVTHSITGYVVWALFAIAFFAGRKQPASAAMFIVVVAALVIRITFAMLSAAKARSATA
jgi:hypothetical protein